MSVVSLVSGVVAGVRGGGVSGVDLDTRLEIIKPLRRKVNGYCYLDLRLEGKRMASGHTGNVVPRKGLRVRISCPPLSV